MYYFCTYFDQRYLTRGLALYRSLVQHCPSFQLWILCMDRDVYKILSEMNLPQVQLISLEALERDDLDLLQAKQNRTLVEYYFTCTPSLPLFILKHWPEVDLITYLDADLFFFADPASIYEEIGSGSVAIIPHRFPPNLRHLEINGIYNVGWVSFRRDEPGQTCLRWWHDRCLEWCYTRLEDGKFGDQKYLDDWPARFRNVVVLQHKGANLATWNLGNYEIRLGPENEIWVDEYRLIFYHFHGLKRVLSWLYNPNVIAYRVKLSKLVRQHIYAPYLSTISEVAPQNYRWVSGLLRGPAQSRWSLYWGRLLRLPSITWSVLQGNFLLVLNDRLVW